MKAAINKVTVYELELDGAKTPGVFKLEHRRDGVWFLEQIGTGQRAVLSVDEPGPLTAELGDAMRAIGLSDEPFARGAVIRLSPELLPPGTGAYAGPFSS